MAVRPTAAAAFASTLALAPVALAADSLSGTRGEIVEKTHAIALEISRGHAHMRVVREVTNKGERHDQALFHLMLPEGAVATGLRTRGTRDGRPVWYEGELLEAELAARRYQELTGIGGYYPKDPALLSWRSATHLALQVFPCPPQEDKGIGYDLDIPTTWVDGREHLTLGEMGLAERFGVATLRTDVPGARLFVDGAEVAPGARVRLDGPHDIELEPPRPFGTLDGRLAAVSFAPGRNLVALRFDAPKEISEVPRGASIVIALDTSRSLELDEVTAEMRAANAYLSHFENKDARVALVAFDRHARDLTRGFVTVPEARAVLDGSPFARGNGSAIDEAVARVGALLAKAPPGSPRRALVLGDLLARDAIEPGRIAPPRGAVLHVATVGASDSPSVSRDDDSDWAVLPRATGGVLYRAGAPTKRLAAATNRDDIERAFLEWARPVRIDRMVWRLPGVDPAVGAAAGVLDEGGTIEHRALQATLPANATIEGELWSKRFEKKVFASTAEGKLWSALVFGTDMLNELSEKEMDVLARAGGAVSPVTSYLAIEPGVRPSTEGLEEGEGRGSGIGLGSMGTIGHGFGVAGGVVAPDYRGILASILAGAVKTCRADGRARIDVETTRAEVVDVSVEVAGDEPDASRAGCVREAVWALELPEVFTPEHLDLAVSL